MRWLWIDSIVEFEPRRRLVAIKQVSMAEEHLHDHFAADEHGPAKPIVPASLMIEGMAQTAGILVGAAESFREKVILAKIVVARFDRDARPGQTIRYEATLDRIDAAGASTSGEVRLRPGPDADWETIGRVDLMFSHIDQNLAGLEFPEENFVFENEVFRTLLKECGIEGLCAEP
jgi:3-hydroxyacyl-[acyl-carrier-protein] dehydratase